MIILKCHIPHQFHVHRSTTINADLKHKKMQITTNICMCHVVNLMTESLSVNNTCAKICAFLRATISISCAKSLTLTLHVNTTLTSTHKTKKRKILKIQTFATIFY